MVGFSRRIPSLAPLALMGALALAVPASAQQPAGDVPITAQLTVRISELEAQIRQLTGQIEDLSATVTQLKQRQDRQASDTDFRLSELEKAKEAGGAAPTAEAPKPAAATPTPAPAVAPGAPPRDLGTVPATTANAPVSLQPGQAQPAAKPAPGAVAAAPAAPAPAAPKAGNAKEAYEQAFALIQKQDYPAAETAFKNFLGTYGADDLAGNAQYWLGETFYVRGNYQEAAAQFFQGYQKYPKNNKAPDNLLKLGLSLAHINKTKEACASFSRFNTEYPQASAFLKRRVQEERARNNCGA